MKGKHLLKVKMRINSAFRGYDCCVYQNLKYFIICIATLLKMCPYFDELDEVYGSKVNLVPPFTHDSMMTSPISSKQAAEEVHGSSSLDGDSEDVGSSQFVPQRSSGTSEEETTAEKATERRKKVKRKSPMKTGITALALTAKLRFEVQREEIDLAKEKWEDEKRRRDSSYELELQKFDHEKYATDRKMALEEKKLENEMELAKFKIEQESKLQLEIAKINSSK
jgi:hypothetical protein